MIDGLVFALRYLLRALVVASALAVPMAVSVPIAVFAPIAVSAQSQEEALRQQLRSLAANEGFNVIGLERIGDETPPRASGDDPLRRLRVLLQGYNYIAAYDAEGKVTEIRILDRRPAPVANSDQFRIETTRRGAHHLVEATLVGPTGAWRKLSLILDTGATNVVLPSSMISQLGFGDTDLSDRWTETAGGRVKAKAGRLASVMVGHATVHDVEVTFIDDEQIGDKALLGMSFLSHFRLTIDEPGDGIMLMAR